MPEQWFCVIDGRQHGPLSDGELRALAQQGRLCPSDRVRRGSAGPWVDASQVKGLFVNAASPDARERPDWFVRADGNILGPFTTAQLETIARGGQLKAHHELRRGVAGQFRSVRDITKLGTSSQPPTMASSETRADAVVRFPCLNCGHRLRCPEKFCGRRANCPNCQAAVMVPVRAAEKSRDGPKPKPVAPPRALHPTVEIIPAKRVSRPGLTIQRSPVRFFQATVNWITDRLAGAAGSATTRGDHRPARDRIEFYGPDRQVDLGFGVMTGPLIYATGRRMPRCVDASLIELPLRVDWRGIEKPARLPYWPTYHDATPAQRARYLRWLSTGRSDPNIEVGYVFIYFYGLERRVLVDGADHELIVRELIRLLAIYGASRSFAKYAGSLLWVTCLLARPGSLPVELISNAISAVPRWTQDSLRTCLACFFQAGLPLPASLAYTIAELDERSSSSVVIKRHAERFRELFEARYAQAFPNGLKLQASRHARAIQHYPASATLLRQRAHLPQLTNRSAHDPLLLSSQFNPLIDIWTSCINELRGFDRASRGASPLKLTAEMYEALPVELRTDDHPELEAWHALMRRDLDEAGWPLVPVRDVAAIKGIAPRLELTQGQCNRILATADALGLAVEPDARLTGRRYRWDEKVILYHGGPLADAEEDGYQASAMLLRLGLTIASADDHIDESELAVITSHIQEHFDLSDAQSKRLDALQHLLLSQGGGSASVPPRILRRIPAAERRLIGRFLVSIAAADQWVSDAELGALKRCFSTLGLPASDLDELLDRRAAAEAASPSTTDREAGQSAPLGRALDLERVRAIMDESQKVQHLLSTILVTEQLEDEDEEAPSAGEGEWNAPASGEAGERVPSALACPPAVVELPAEFPRERFAAIPARYHPFLASILGRSEWNVQELRELARRHKVMLSAAIEEINEWSHAELGDWLVEEMGDVVRLQLSLLNESEGE